jgi:hypothetical protein
MITGGRNIAGTVERSAVSADPQGGIICYPGGKSQRGDAPLIPKVVKEGAGTW